MNLKKKMISCVVLDSPFNDSYVMMKKVSIQQADISNMTAKLALFMFKGSITSHVGYDVVGKNKPIDLVQICKTPAMFMKGDNDTMINHAMF